MAEFSRKIKIISITISIAGLAVIGFFAYKYTGQYYMEKNKAKEKQEIKMSWQNVLDGNFSEAVRSYKTLVQFKKSKGTKVSRSMRLQMSIAEINSREFDLSSSKEFSDAISNLTKLALNDGKSDASARIRSVAFCRLAELALFMSSDDERVINEKSGLERLKSQGGDVYELYENLLTESIRQNPQATVSYQLANLYAQNVATRKFMDGSNEGVTNLLREQAINEFKRTEASIASAGPGFKLNPDRQFLSYLYRARTIYLLDQAGVDLAASGLPRKEEAGEYFEKVLSMREDKWLASNPDVFEYLGRLYYAMYLSSQDNVGSGPSVSSMLAPLYEKKINGRVSVYNLLAKQATREKFHFDVKEVLRLADKDPKFKQLLIDLGWESL